MFYKILMLIGRFFRWILKGFKKIKNFFATLGFLPKQLDKRAVWAVALFSLFNILGMSFVALFLPLSVWILRRLCADSSVLCL